eukprot:1716181-Rhodomonas_salina.4
MAIATIGTVATSAVTSKAAVTAFWNRRRARYVHTGGISLRAWQDYGATEFAMRGTALAGTVLPRAVAGTGLA